MKKQKRNNEDNRGVAIYARKSRITNKGDSIGVQFKQCAEYAKRELLKRKSISSLSSLKSEIEKLSSYGESTEDYFYILLDMNLAQADELICDLAVHTDSFILRESLFDAVVKRSVIENSIPAGFGRFNPEKDN